MQSAAPKKLTVSDRFNLYAKRETITLKNGKLKSKAPLLPSPNFFSTAMTPSISDDDYRRFFERQALPAEFKAIETYFAQWTAPWYAPSAKPPVEEYLAAIVALGNCKHLDVAEKISMHELVNAVDNAEFKKALALVATKSFSLKKGG